MSINIKRVINKYQTSSLNTIQNSFFKVACDGRPIPWCLRCSLQIANFNNAVTSLISDAEMSRRPDYLCPKEWCHMHRTLSALADSDTWPASWYATIHTTLSLRKLLYDNECCFIVNIFPSKMLPKVSLWQRVKVVHNHPENKRTNFHTQHATWLYKHCGPSKSFTIERRYITRQQQMMFEKFIVLSSDGPVMVIKHK